MCSCNDFYFELFLILKSMLISEGKCERDINQMDVYNLLIEYLKSELEFNLQLYSWKYA